MSEQLNRQFQLGIDSIVDTKDRLIVQKSIYENLELQIGKNLKIIDDEMDNNTNNSKTILVMLGDGYFVEMKPQEALDFLRRRLKNLSKVIGDFDEKINDSKRLMLYFSALEKLGTAPNSNNDIPANDTTFEKISVDESYNLMDIVEELDDDDNIIGIKVNDELVPLHLINQETFKPQAQVMTSSQYLNDSELKKQAFKGNIKGKYNNIPEDTGAISQKAIIDDKEDHEQFSQILKDMEIKEPILTKKINDLDITNEDKTILKDALTPKLNESESLDIREKVIQELQKVKDKGILLEESLQDHITIERKDLLELELIADDLHTANDDEEIYEESNQDSDYDFDFEEENDDQADDLLYGTKKFFKDDKINNLLWSLINQLRNGSEIEEDFIKRDDGKGKKVKFADSLDIFEIEKIKKEDIEEAKRVSIFKQRLFALNSELEGVTKHTVPNVEESMSNVIETRNGSEFPVTDIIENPIIEGNNINKANGISINNRTTDTPKKVSKFKQDKANQYEAKNISALPQITKNGDTHESISSKKSFLYKDEHRYEDEEEDEEEDKDKDANELIRMIRDYNQESEDIEGPIIKEIKDLENYNRLNEKLNIKDYELHDHDHKDNEIESTDDSKNMEIMTDVVEKELNYNPETKKEYEDLIAQEQFDQQIQKEYFKLKSKLNSNNEFEFEKPKVSKFKQRLG